jgi:hypothetical protein
MSVMSDHGLALVDFASALRADVERHHIHPVGASRCHELLTEMFEAAAGGDSHEVKRLARLVQRRVKLERLWRIESWLTAYHDRHPRLRRWVHAELEAQLDPLFSPDWRTAC